MLSLDGYFEGPNKEIDWHNVDAEFNDFAIEQLNNASILVFGRITYELMAGYWSTDAALNDDPVVADKMNSIDKIVFSKTLHKADWNNTKLFKDVSKNEVRNLKQKSNKDIFIFGSANLASTFINLNLIDEFRLIINPIVLGQGHSLFNPTNKQLKLKFQRVRVFKSGNVLLYYESPDV
jgi:dihydrofolate reductase